MEARGSAVAKVLRAKASGVSELVSKLMEEKVVEPDVTSGTLEIVLAELEQVTRAAMELSASMTSWGRAVEPMTKQGFAWRVRTVGTGRGVRMYVAFGWKGRGGGM